MNRTGRRAAAIAATAGAMAVAPGCAGDYVVLAVAGEWHVIEAFADDIHQVSCVGEGTLTLQHVDAGGGVAGPTGVYDGVTGTAGVDTDCMSLDGPFNYFGNGVFTNGVVAPIPDNALRWEGTVNDAVCAYQGTATGTPPYADEMTGTLTCVLEDPGVTFNFEGTWTARNWRNPWCAERRELPGCAESG